MRFGSPGKRQRHRGEGGLTEDVFLGQVEGEIAEDQIGARAFDSAEAFQNHFLFIDSARLGGEFDHRVLPADLIRAERQIAALADIAQNIQVGARRFHHQAVGALGFIEQRLANGFPAVHRAHLIGFTIALQRGTGRFAERAVEGRGELGRIGHDRRIGEAGGVQRAANRLHLTIHRGGRGR